MKIIRIPRTPPSAFDKNRPVSDLLKAQVQHAKEVELQLEPGQRAAIAARPIETEREAAEYIGEVTKRLLHKRHKPWRLPPGRRAPMSGVWLGPASLLRKKTRKPAKRKPTTKAKRRTPKAKRAGRAKPRVKARKSTRRHR